MAYLQSWLETMEQCVHQMYSDFFSQQAWGRVLAWRAGMFNRVIVKSVVKLKCCFIVFLKNTELHQRRKVLLVLYREIVVSLFTKSFSFFFSIDVFRQIQSRRYLLMASHYCELLMTNNVVAVFLNFIVDLTGHTEDDLLDFKNQT